jgi:two-component system chemotaxis response regulator CheY
VAAPLERVRFLHVDDNAHMLNIVRTMLRGLGVEHVLEARTAEQAFERLRHDSIDIVLLDYAIGEDDGVEFLRALRCDPASPAPFVPVIMLTAHSERARVEAARDAGVNEFCTKPITANDLVRKLTVIIEHPRQFVRTDTYVGPDRRRRDDPAYRGPERRRDRQRREAAPDA